MKEHSPEIQVVGVLLVDSVLVVCDLYLLRDVSKQLVTCDYFIWFAGGSTTADVQHATLIQITILPQRLGVCRSKVLGVSYRFQIQMKTYLDFLPRVARRTFQV